MVKKLIFSSEKGAYVAPVSKTYSVVLESVIAGSNDNPGNGYDPEHPVSDDDI